MQNPPVQFAYPWDGLENYLADNGLDSLELLSYGSLMNKRSAALTLSNVVQRSARPGIARGIRRVFNYPMPEAGFSRHGRPHSPVHTAALNVQWTGAPEDVVNGILLSIPIHEIPGLRAREENYRLIQVETVPWHATGSPPSPAFALELCNPTEGLFPHISYLQVCEDGARSISEDFLQEFRRTTFLADGTPLNDWNPGQVMANAQILEKDDFYEAMKRDIENAECEIIQFGEGFTGLTVGSRLVPNKMDQAKKYIRFIRDVLEQNTALVWRRIQTTTPCEPEWFEMLKGIDNAEPRFELYLFNNRPADHLFSVVTIDAPLQDKGLLYLLISNEKPMANQSITEAFQAIRIPGSFAATMASRLNDMLRVDVPFSRLVTPELTYEHLKNWAVPAHQGKHVFIGHKFDGRGNAYFHELRDFFEALGFKVLSGSPYGGSIPESVKERIQKSDFLVAVLQEDVNNLWIHQELDYATNLKKRVLILAEESAPIELGISGSREVILFPINAISKAFTQLLYGLFPIDA